MIDDDNDENDDVVGDDKIDDDIESEGDVNNNKVITHIESNMVFKFCNTINVNIKSQ